MSDLSDPAPLHIRQQIREALATLLTGLETTGANVFTSRTRPLRPSECPGLHLRSGPESGPVRTSAGFPASVTRTYSLVCEIFVRQADGYEDAIDAILAEIEFALTADRQAYSLNGVARGGVDVGDIAEPEIDGDGEKAVIRCDATLNAQYFMDQNDPTTPR